MSLRKFDFGARRLKSVARSSALMASRDATKSERFDVQTLPVFVVALIVETTGQCGPVVNLRSTRTPFVEADKANGGGRIRCRRDERC